VVLPCFQYTESIMDAQQLRFWLENKATLSFSRSSGPGGQNVNKVNTKVSIFVPLGELPGLSDFERSLLLEKLAGRLSEGHVLVVQVQDTRSQLQNRELAVERILSVLHKALHRDKPRRPTKPTRASQERRLVTKKTVARHKANRDVRSDD